MSIENINYGAPKAAVDSLLSQVRAIGEQIHSIFFLSEIEEHKQNPWEFFDNEFTCNETVHALLDFWRGTELFQPRITILEKALLAHLEKNYVVSIPMLLIQIDGALVDLLPGSKSIGSRTEKIKNTKASSFQKTTEGEASVEEIVCEVLIDQLFKKWFPGDGLHKDSFPNRHQILHGCDLEYFNQPYYSLKCILLLDGLLLLKKVFDQKLN